MMPPRVGLIGLSGYALVHLQHLREMHERGEIVLAAVVALPPDQTGLHAQRLRAQGCVVLEDLEGLLAQQAQLRLDLVIVPTPIHLHARMTIALVRAGLHVLVEKPLAATNEEAKAIMAEAAAAKRTVAVGFQYLHAPEVVALKARLAAGAIGRLQRLVVHAAWPRSHAYYTRNAWAGRLRSHEDWVLDSPLSNAMSHFFMVMLALAGDGPGVFARPVRIEAELYRAQAIESFDTAAVRMVTAEGVQLDFYGTHSSQEISRPSLRVMGESGAAEWVQDRFAAILGAEENWEQAAFPESATRETMLRDILAHLRGEPAAICTPADAAIHVQCVAALHAEVPISSIAPAHLALREEGEQVFTFVPGLDAPFARAAAHGLTLAQAGLPWATPPRGTSLAR